MLAQLVEWNHCLILLSVFVSHFVAKGRRVMLHHSRIITLILNYCHYSNGSKVCTYVLQYLSAYPRNTLPSRRRKCPSVIPTLAKIILKHLLFWTVQLTEVAQKVPSNFGPLCQLCHKQCDQVARLLVQ